MNVRIEGYNGHDSDVTRCLLLTDAVDKVGDEQRAGNNEIQVPSFLNDIARQTPIFRLNVAHSPLEKRLSTASVSSGHTDR